MPGYSTIGATELVKKFGTPLKVAEALILGELKGYEQQYVSQVVSVVMLEAAKIRIESGLTYKDREEAKNG